MDENKSVPENSVVVNVQNISEDLIKKHSSDIKNRDYWHAFIIHNIKNLNRNEILKIILNYVYPEALLPTHFKTSGPDCIFLARNCYGAIFKLLNNKLVIPYRTDASQAFTCEIILKYSTVSQLPLPASNISTVLELLYEHTSKTLNLGKFSDNKGLTEYNPLSQPKLLCFALRISDKMKPAYIKLNDNEIKTLSPFEVLRGISSVKKLDLRNNLIEDIEELENLKVFDLTELWLDGNPLCEKYDAFSYVQTIKQILPMLEKLDGVSLGQSRLPMAQQNFLCSKEGFDLVDQFVTHFFSLYDSKREILKDLYHPSAMFSMTTACGQITGENDRLCVYRALSRNILDSSSTHRISAIGIIGILDTFLKLPRTKHNMQTFSVDLFYYSERSAIFSIIGTFCEDSTQKFLPEVFGFKRTFTLFKHACDYVIHNELLHIYKASEPQTRDAFGNNEVKVNPHTFSERDKNMAEEAMSRITGVNSSWIKRLLEDAHYNIIQFLRTFMTLEEKNKIPDQAYSQNNECSLLEWLIPKMIEVGMGKFENSLQEEALDYIMRNPTFLTNINVLSMNMSSTVMPKENPLQHCIQKYGCQNLEMSINRNYSNCQMVMDISNQNGYTTHVSEYSFQSSEILKYHIPHPKKNRNKKSISEVENIIEIQNKKKNIDIMPGSKTTTCNSSKEINSNLIVKLQANIHKRSNLILVQTNNANETHSIKETPTFQEVKGLHQISSSAEVLENSTPNLLVDPIKSTSPAGKEVSQKSNQSSNIDDKLQKSKFTVSKSNAVELVNEQIDIEFRPKLALLFGKWTNVEDCDQYDFQLTFNNWMLMQKNAEGKWISKQDDFQKNFICWKKHFPTYSKEVLNHFLRAPCISSHLKSVFDTINFPVTYWDFPATVPGDIRPPKHIFLHEDGTDKVITPGSGYGFIFVHDKWTLVFCNNINKLVMVKTKKNVLWKDNKWVLTEQFNTKKVDIPIKSRVTKTDATVNNKLEEDTLIICDDEEQEIDAEDLDFFEQLEQEEIKTVYDDDTQTEETITTTNCAFHLSHNTGKSDVADRLIKWKKIYEFFSYIPTIALIEGYWTVVSEKPSLKFHRTHLNEWMLLEKNSKTNEWQVFHDDFCVDQGMLTHEEKVKLSDRLGNNVFDHIPMPVTKYDFPSSVPSKLLPPGKLVIGKDIIKVTPDSDYKYLSINGQWTAVKKNEQHRWKAVHDAHKTVVEKKIANMSVKFTDNKTTIKLESADDEKINSATCTLLQILTGTKLVKPLTHSDIKGPEEKRPPKIALTEINGKQQWRYVTPGSGKGFVFEDGVWVKVVLSSGEWKATLFTAHQGCVVGYYLFNNIWVTMKKYILGGKWSPIFNIETTPTTYWNYIGPEELKPPRKIFVSETEKIIHNNTNMGFIKKGDFWILMEKTDGGWQIVKDNQNFCIYKLINGTWRMIGRDSTGKWLYAPNKQNLLTYQCFSGLKKHAPPKQVNFLKGDNKIKKIINEESGMGFILNDGVWVLMQLKNENLIPVKNAKGQANIGYKRINEKFKIIRMDENGEWINLEKSTRQEVEIPIKSIALHQKFKDAVPLTYDRILIDLPNNMKPPRYAMIKGVKNRLCWRLVDENSGYGFIRENDMWLLMTWTFDKNWVSSLDDSRYKIINNRWVPMKNEHDKWVPMFDPNTTPIIPDLCIESPEKDLPNKIEIETKKSKSKINITPSSGMGYMKYSDEYVLMSKMLNGKWVLFEQNIDTALVLKMNDKGKWIQSERNISSFNNGRNVFDLDKVGENEKVSTYGNAEGTKYTKPPQYIKMMEGDMMKWKEVKINDGFGFVKRKYWILVRKTEGNWTIVNKNEGYDIMDNRWLTMKKNQDGWLPSFDPRLTPRCSLDNVYNIFVFPVRVITYKNGHAKYINTANDCSLGFIIDKPKVYILMKEQDGTWITMKDDFQEAPTMAFKVINGKWQRMKKDTKMDQWIPCKKQFDLPVLHIDIVGKPSLQPPSVISVHDSDNKECKMSFDIFSNEGFIQKQGVWVLMKWTDYSWSKYPGIFGCYGYKMVDGNLIVMEEKKDKWEECNHANNPIIHPITYKETEGWPEVERPPVVFYLHHISLLVEADETACLYGFVKNKDVWLVVKRNNESWVFEKNCNKHVAYKLIDKRWVPMEMNDLNDWIPIYNPSCTPCTHFDTAGKFEERPPLRIISNDRTTWTTIYYPSKYGFIKDNNNIWVLMKKTNNCWKIYDEDNEQLGYKIVDGQWRRFTKDANGVWNICTKAIPPVLSCDFMAGNKNAPPNSLCFENLSESNSLNHMNIGLHSGKGFIVDNGAWLLMENQKGKWQKVHRFPRLRGTFGYILDNNVWRIASKEIDGSWKCGFINTLGRWIYDSQLYIPVTKPLCTEEVGKLPLYKRPPTVFIIYIGARPKVVSLSSVNPKYGFQYYKGAWVLLELNEKKNWNIAGGVIAYKLIDSRWVTMKMKKAQWIPLYDPVTTPITHFECVSSHRDSKPPIRVVLNESGEDIWKIIVQHSGYGFIEHGDMWVLMKKRCDGTWELHRDYLSESTGYRMVDKQWTRFKQRKYGDWVRMDSSLPLLQCDFSVLHNRKPPPYFKRIFRVEIKNKPEIFDTYLDLYSKFGFQLDNDVWILMKYDGAHSWSEYYHPKQTVLYGYMCSGDSWELMRKNENGQWTRSKLEHIEGSWKILKEEINHVKQGITDKYVKEKTENKVKDGKNSENKHENKDKKEERLEKTNECEDQKKHTVNYETKSGEEDKNGQEFETGNKQGVEYEIKGVIVDKNDEHVNEQEVNITNKQEVDDRNEQVVKHENEEIFKYKSKHEVEIENKLEMIDNNKETIEDKKVQEVVDKNVETLEDEDEQEVEGGKKLERNDDNKETSKDKNEQVEDENKQEIDYQNIKKIDDDHNQEVGHRSEVLIEVKDEQDIDDVNLESMAVENRRDKNGLNVENENKQEVNCHNKETVGNKKEQEDENKKRVGDKNGHEDKVIIENKQVSDNKEGTVEDKNVQGIRDLEPKINNKNEQTTTEKNYRQNGCEKENLTKCVHSNSREIPITNPMRYHEFEEFSIEKKPPKNVCLKVRGTYRRISLASKKSKIGFQDHNGVWVLLENLSGVWKILHNSAGFPLAYKLIDNRWVSMRLDNNGSWLPTFNPLTTPRTYFDSEGPEDTKPPRRVVLNENGVLKWKEISEFSGFGFVKNEDMWILMSNPSNNNWLEYRNDNQEICAFKIHDFKWTKFTKGEEGSWKISVEDLPVLSYDFASSSEAAPPEFTPYLHKIISKETTNFGFQWDSGGAWILMQCNENNDWIPISGTKNTCGFVRAKGDLWNVLKKDCNGKWVKVEMNRSFQSAFEDLFPIGEKRDEEIVETSNKKIKLEFINPSSSFAGTEQNSIKHKSDHVVFSTENDPMEKIRTPAEGVVLDRYTQSTTSKLPILNAPEEKTYGENYILPEAAVNLDQTVPSSFCNSTDSSKKNSEFTKQSDDEGSQSVERVQKQMELHPTKLSRTENMSSPVQKPPISPFESEKPKSSCEEQVEQETRKDPKAVQNREELNSVELYLAVKPDCCLGCPELQNLLRKYRPSNVPNKIIRKNFRLPDGSMRLLSIPKAVSDSQKPIEDQEKIRTKRKIDTRILDYAENSSDKRMKCNE